jgi:hypothetical protein
MLFVITMIGMLSLFVSTITYQNLAYNSQLRKSFSEKLAKRAAEFSLKVALARLQESAGMDNAISAKRSNIEISSNGNDIGIWHVFKNNKEYSVKFSRWLTSAYDSEKLNGASEKSNSRTHLGTNNLNWSFTIQDESQKIDLSLRDNTNDNYVKLLCPQCSSYEEVATILSAKNRSVHECKNMDFLEQFSLFDDELGKNIVNNSSTYTLHSYGVLSTLNGLKTDLSTWLPDGKFQADDYIFEGKTSLPAPPPTWKFLQSFFKLKDQIGASGIQVSPTYPLYRPQYLKDYAQRTLDNLGDDLGTPTNHGIYPLIAQLNFSISVAVIDSKLAIKICPKCALWNPHNISLQQTDYQLDASIAPRDANAKICITINGKPRGQNIPNKILILPLCSDEIEQHLRRMFGMKFGCTFNPGEVKIFSLPADTNLLLTRVTDATPGDYNNCLLIKTDITVSDYLNFTISCTDQNGSQNLNWQEFYIRLIHQPSRAILQEIAQLTPINNNQSLSLTFRPEETEKLLLTLLSTMKIGSLEDAQTETGIRWLAFANPRAPYVNRAVFQDPSSIFFGKECISGNWSWNIKFTDGKTTLSYQQLNYLNGLALFDVPSHNHGVLSIAALQHVNWTPFGYLPGICMGNSNPNPYIPTNYTIFQNAQNGIWPSHNKVESLLDYSYLLNETLFDNFFCSTLNVEENKLANQRFKILATPIGPDTLLVRGSFNVHSTSEEAWEAYLNSRINDSNEVIFPRIYNTNANQCASFSKHEAKNLTASIVTLIKQRSLFPTLSTFVNRQLSGEMSYGLLQQAIFDSNINHKTCKYYISFNKNKSWFNDGVASGYLEEGLPNVLNQADILQALAHFATVRGDTFKIISQGSHGHSTKRCEVIVQRMPTFVNQMENIASDVMLSEANKKLGRRFRIILFRWI